MLGNLELTSQPWHHWRFGLDNSFLLGVLSWALQNVNSGPGSFSLEAGVSVSPLPQRLKPKSSRCIAKCWGGGQNCPQFWLIESTLMAVRKAETWHSLSVMISVIYPHEWDGRLKEDRAYSSNFVMT